MATKIVTKNSSTASAVPTASDLVQGELAVNVADKRLFTEDNGGAIVELGTNPYNFTANYNGSAKLTTTATGIDVTGTATMDGLTVTGTLGNFAVDTQGVIATFSRPSTSYIRASDVSGSLRFDAGGSLARLNIASNGDISFYEDTGTTPKFFWDASAEALAVGGTNTFTSKIVASAANGTAYTSNSQLRISGGGTNNNRASIMFSDDALSDGKISYYPHATEASRLLSLSARTTESDFVITGAGNVGIGTSSPSRALDVRPNATDDWQFRLGSNAGTLDTYDIGRDVGDGLLYFKGNQTGYTGYVFDSIDGERMRIDSSGNVGIGKTPNTNFSGYVLQLNGGSQTFMSFGNSTTGTTLSDGLVIGNDNSGADIYQREAQPLRFHTSNTERMRIDSSGNVGIGTSSPAAKLHVSNGSSGFEFSPDGISDGTSYMQVYDRVANSYDNLRYYAREHYFHCDNFEKMRIDSSGNLLVGGTSAFGADTITLGTGGFAGIRNTSGSCLELRRDSTDGSILDFQKDGTTVGSIGYGGGAILYNAASNYGLKFYDAGGANIIHPATTAGGDLDGSVDLGYAGARFKDLYLSGSVSTNTATGLSITANSSNRGILNLSTSTAYQLIGGAYYGYTGYKTGGYHRFFGSDGSEDMRIDSSGNLALGDSNAYTHRLFVKGVGANEAVGLAVGTNNTNIIRFYNSGLGTAGAIKVNSGGTTVTYNTSSDQRLKENIADADDAGSKIDAIQVRQYDWKADGSHQDYGMIAQELQAVAPEAVSGDADSEEMMGVDYSKLVPMLIKEIQSLRNRVAQLEG